MIADNTGVAALPRSDISKLAYALPTKLRPYRVY